MQTLNVLNQKVSIHVNVTLALQEMESLAVRALDHFTLSNFQYVFVHFSPRQLQKLSFEFQVRDER